MCSYDMPVTWRWREGNHEFEANLCCLGALCPQARKHVPLVGIFTDPYKQNSSESVVPALAFSVRIEKIYCLVSMCPFSALYKTAKNKQKNKKTNQKKRQTKNKTKKTQASLDLLKGENNSFKIAICQYLPLVWELLLFLKLKSEND